MTASRRPNHFLAMPEPIFPAIRFARSLRASVYLFLLLESVNGVQHSYARGAASSPCMCPYSCITTSECAVRHATKGTEEVLFLCGEKGKICCPPVRSSTFKHFERQHTGQAEYTGYGDDCPGDQVQNNQYEYVEATTTQRVVSVPVNHKGRPTEPQRNYYHVPSGLYVHTDDILKQQQQKQQQRPNGPGERRPPLPLDRPQPPPQSLTKRKPPLTAHRNFRLLPTESNCGISNFANRITEGEEVSLGEYPWMVLTGVKDRYGNYRWNCGGTLINGWYVLTAAHCLVVDNRTIEYVRLGEHSLTNATDCQQDVCLDPPVDISVAEVIPHEKWNTTTIKNDIALIRLSINPLHLGKSNIYPICLPFDIGKLNLTSTSKYEVAGWGKTDWNADEGSDVLRKASISGVSREECNICKDKKKQQYCPISDTQLCVQGWKAVDVCKGDSGGPLMLTRLNVYQIGITSFKGSDYCGAENIPSIFTKVENYMNWILDNIKC